MYCKHCGRPIPETAFCKYCGNPTGFTSAHGVSGLPITPITGFIAAPAAVAVATGIGVKRHIGRIIAILLVLAILGSSGFVYIDKYMSTPEKTLNNFTDAFNDGNMDKMFACCDPKFKKIFGMFTGIAGGLTGFDAEKILSGAFAFSSLINTDQIPKLSINILNINYTSKNIANVNAELVATYSTGEVQKQQGPISMKKINFKWCIEG